MTANPFQPEAGAFEHFEKREHFVEQKALIVDELIKADDHSGLKSILLVQDREYVARRRVDVAINVDESNLAGLRFQE